MTPEERENLRYSRGAQNPVEVEEQIMFSLLPDGKQMRLLDVGCGIGNISLELKKRGYQVTGVDFSEVAIRQCLLRAVNAILSDMDHDGLKFPDKSFDIVWAGDVIEHVFDPISVFKEISRVINDNGCLLLSVPNDFNLFRQFHILFTGKSIQSNVYRTAKQCKHHTFFSWELLEYMLTESEFSINRYFSFLYINEQPATLLSIKARTRAN